LGGIDQKMVDLDILKNGGALKFEFEHPFKKDSETNLVF